MPAPTYPTVPDQWKSPFGPYRQAPVESGGEWWYVNPFTTEAPWALEEPEVSTPEGFAEIFGPAPDSNDFHEETNPSLAFRIAKTAYEQDLKYFVRAGVPEFVSPYLLELTQQTTEAWGMGRASFYEGRYGWMAYFGDVPLPHYESVSIHTLVNTPHLIVAKYQSDMVSNGYVIPVIDRHPFTPPHLFGDVDQS